ncbi:Rossmann-like domain-containing protein [Nocardia sp. NPDC057227]|uniref:Rossmann-like domain-containing protein n=1 Tax=Nocardia sp. NPDC057227 TaxID=3346056 RepID=UPI003627C43A
MIPESLCRVTDLTELAARVRAAAPAAAAAPVTVAFTTHQGAKHAGRRTGYRNHVLSLRVGAAVGSAAVAPGSVTDDAVHACVGRQAGALFEHPLLPVRVAALDAVLAAAWPHAGEPVTVPGGDSRAKSEARAAAVVELLGAGVRRVLVVGVVNSLLRGLRARGIGYLACDHIGGHTEWGEPIGTDAEAALPGCDALLVSGMTLANGTLEPLRRSAAARGLPLVVFAQTGAAVLRCFVGAGVTALSAEPYPFFWLDGGPSVLHRYRQGEAA